MLQSLMEYCILCSKLLERRSQKKFCSRHCSIIYNNHHKPKKIKGENNFCKCGKIKERSAKRCMYCIKDGKAARILRDIIYLNGKGAQKWVYVRNEARDLMKRWGVEKKCGMCSWKKHVEVVHIKDISTFPLDTLVSVVNSRENLKYLCPNHHWEFDNKKVLSANG